MKLSKFMLGLVLISALCFAGCSDGSSGSSSSGVGSNSDGNKEYLDLRIQNNGTIAGSSRSIEQEADSSNLYEASTELVSAVAKEDGIHFTIKNPVIAFNDEYYREHGCSYISVTRLENINGVDNMRTTTAVLNNLRFCSFMEEEYREEINFVYPLCEVGEVYKFLIEMAPITENSIGGEDKKYYHYVTVKAKGGIGDIDYSNFSYGDWAFASCSDGKAKVWTENVIPPQDTVVKNVHTYIDIFYGDNNWNGNTGWLMSYESKEDVEESVSDIELKQQYGEKTIQELGANTFFAHYMFYFSVPNTPEVTRWRTVGLATDLVEVD